MRRATAVLLLLGELVAGPLAGPAQAQAPASQAPAFQAPARLSGSGYQGAAGWAWFATAADLRRCTDTSAATLRAAGYVVDRVGPDEDAVVAGRDGNFLLVTCIVSHDVVSVAWNGRDPAGSRAAIRQLSAALGNRNAQGPGAAGGSASGAAAGGSRAAPVGEVGAPPPPASSAELPRKPR